MTATATPPPTTAHAQEPLLSVRDLRVTFTRQGEEPFTAVEATYPPAQVHGRDE